MSNNKKGTPITKKRSEVKSSASISKQDRDSIMEKTGKTFEEWEDEVMDFSNLGPDPDEEKKSGGEK